MLKKFIAFFFAASFLLITFQKAFVDFANSRSSQFRTPKTRTIGLQKAYSVLYQEQFRFNQGMPTLKELHIALKLRLRDPEWYDQNHLNDWIPLERAREFVDKGAIDGFERPFKMSISPGRIVELVSSGYDSRFDTDDDIIEILGVFAKSSHND